MIWNTDNMCWK